MRILFILAMSVAALAGTAPAQANCFWEVSTRLIGYRPGNTALNSPARYWELGSLETRIRVRTQNGLWNTVNWPTTRTNAQGFAMIRSTHAFPDPLCQANRLVEVQIRSLDTGMQWRTVYAGNMSGPGNQYQGLLAPIPTHNASAGYLVIDGEWAGPGVIFIEGLTEPPVELNGPPPDDSLPTGTIEPSPGFEPEEDNPGPDPSNARFERDHCAPYRLARNIEFRFGQMPSEPGPLSGDSHLRVEARRNSGGNGDLTLNMLRTHILVENAGSRQFNRIYHCPSYVWVRTNEGPGMRSGDGWSNPWRQHIPDLAPNAVEPIEIDINLYGSGYQFPGEWDEPYDYVLIEVTLDANNRIREAAEGDNRILHCYHASTNTFAAMTNCEG